MAPRRRKALSPASQRRALVPEWDATKGRSAFDADAWSSDGGATPTPPPTPRKAVVGESADFHKAIAEPLPSTVFLQLLGLPVSRSAEFTELKDGIIRPEAESEAERAAALHATGTKIYAVLEEVVAERSREPRDDFISGFLASEVDGERLTPEEVVDLG